MFLCCSTCGKAVVNGLLLLLRWTDCLILFEDFEELKVFNIEEISFHSFFSPRCNGKALLYFALHS